MKRTVRRGLPMALVAALVVAGGVLLAARPWERHQPQVFPEDPDSVTGYTYCNVSVSVKPGSGISAFPRAISLPRGGGRIPVLMVVYDEPAGGTFLEDPGYGIPVYSVSLGLAYDQTTGDTGYALPPGFALDAESGEVLGRAYRSPGDEALLEGVLATLQIGHQARVIGEEEDHFTFGCP